MDRTASLSVLHQRNTGEHLRSRAQTAHRGPRTQRIHHPDTGCVHIFISEGASPLPAHFRAFHIFPAEFQDFRAGKASRHRKGFLEDHFPAVFIKQLLHTAAAEADLLKFFLLTGGFQALSQDGGCLLYMELPPFRGVDV